MVAVISINDRAMYISTGVGARERLTDSQAVAIVDSAKPYLRRAAYDAAMEEIVGGIVVNLRDGPKTDWFGLIFALVVGGIIVASVGAAIYQCLRECAYKRRRAKLRRLQTEVEAKRAVPVTSACRCR